MSGAAGPVSSSILKQMVWPIRLSHFFDELEDGPHFATGPSAVALPALLIVSPLSVSATSHLKVVAKKFRPKCYTYARARTHTHTHTHSHTTGSLASTCVARMCVRERENDSV